MHTTLQVLPGKRWKDHCLSPIQVLFAPDPRRIAALQLHTDETEKVHQELPPDTNFLHETIAPKNKDTKKL